MIEGQANELIEAVKGVREELAQANLNSKTPYKSYLELRKFKFKITSNDFFPTLTKKQRLFVLGIGKEEDKK